MGCWAWPESRRKRDQSSLRRDSIHQQYRSIDACDAGARAGRKVWTANGPVAVAETDSTCAVVQALFEHDDLTDVTVAGAMTRERAIELALAHTVLSPEVEREHGRGKDQKPGHVIVVEMKWGARIAA